VLDQRGSLFWMPVWPTEFDGRTDVQPMESFSALPQTVEVAIHVKCRRSEHSVQNVAA
jgi:hypothetical protein